LGSDGAAYCWGGNWVGQLGNGSTADTSAPVLVSGGLSFASLSVGFDHSCAVTRGGTLYCWGARHWLIGDVDTAGFDRTPVAIAGGLAVSAVSAGYGHNCAVTSGGAVYCWGDNFAGQLGTGDTINRQGPAPVRGGLAFTAVSAGFSHTCGLTAGGSAYCWGDNWYGELGDGDTTGYSPTPVPVAGGLTFKSISAGFDVTCGLTSAGAAMCWGVNALGLLGNGTTSGPRSCDGVPCGSMPVAVVGGHTFVALSTHNSTCALTADGAVYCWGVNDQGQLGDGSTSNRPSPVRVAGT
jgi:alpha-tubulin suppressor-like RCC1 family protein